MSEQKEYVKNMSTGCVFVRTELLAACPEFRACLEDGTLVNYGTQEMPDLNPPKEEEKPAAQEPAPAPEPVVEKEAPKEPFKKAGLKKTGSKKTASKAASKSE